MCEPTTIAGIAMSMAGAAYNSHQQSKNEKAMANARNSAAEAEDIRQRGYQEESDATFGDSLAGFNKDDQEAAVTKKKEQRTAQIDRNVQNDEYSGGGAAPAVVKGEVARKINDAMKSGKSEAKNLANVGAWGDQQFGNKVALGRSSGILSETTDKARMSANLLPGDQRSAEHNASSTPNMFGDILQAAGQGTAMYGMAGNDIFSGWGGGNPVVTPNAMPQPLALKKPGLSQPILY
jgi:hypothetical protein